VTSFSTKKLDKILDDLREDADVIGKLIPLVQQQEHVEERKNSDDERQLARIARTEIAAYVLEERNLRLQNETERKSWGLHFLLIERSFNNIIFRNAAKGCP
jgi:hypothetical protein